MRPTVGETLANVRGMLEGTILPDVTSPHAKRVAAEVLIALKQLESRWDKVIPNLMEENEDLEGLFRDALADLQKAEVRQGSRELVSLAEQLRRELEKCVDSKYPSYPLLEDTNRRYQGLLAEAILTLDKAEDTLGDDVELQEIRKRIRGHLRKYVDREVQAWGIDIKAPWGA